MSKQLYNDYMYLRYGGNKMVTFKSKSVGGLERLDISVDGVLRFHAIKDLTWWNVWTLGYKKLVTECENVSAIETYVSEMDS